MLKAGELKVVLREHGLRLSKRLGQHYLIDRAAVRRIVEACTLTGSETVVEIGAGLGALTEDLAGRAARVIAVEVDGGIAPVLEAQLAHLSNVSVIPQDILQYAWPDEPVIAVGAIPYQITSQILVQLADHRYRVPRAILVVQREVAQRLTAPPNTKAYGRLSVLGQYSWRIDTVLTVPRHAFFPQPAVDSTCLRLTVHASPQPAVADEARFFALVKAAFAHRRKTLVNCLGSEAPFHLLRADAEALLRACGLPVAVRGEALSLTEFARLSDGLAR